MLRWLSRLLLVVGLFSALVVTDSFARPLRTRRPPQPQREQTRIHQPQRLQRPQRARRIPCRPQRPQRPQRLTARHRANSLSNLADPCQASRALAQSIESLIDDDIADGLNEYLLSNNLTQTFSNESIQNAIEQSVQDVGQIVSVEAGNDLSILESGEWITQTLTLTTNQGIQQDFLVVYHLEEGEWKLFGTLLR